MTETTCNHVKVTAPRLKVLIGLGVNVDGATAEQLSELLDVELGTVIEALDGLLRCEVSRDEDAELFHLTEYGLTLFHAIYEAVKEVSD